MCGLAGIFDTSGRRPIDPDRLRRMTDALVHRGPDGCGFHIAPGIGLGHRRLAIIDLEGGRQPLANEDGQVSVVFNGEIYNYKELAVELAAAGHVFQTLCDTEVIVHAWEEWGAASVRRLHGMFAFALWDERRQTLFLARERLGKKPLHYALLADGHLLFGSELKALLVDPALPRELDPLSIEDYFAFGYVPDPRSIYRAVRKLPPGHYLIWPRGAAEPEPQPYWDLMWDGAPVTDLADAQVELSQRLRDATRRRLVSEVPLGAFLSGGVDSSGVVAMMAGLSADPVRTFSIAFAESDHDESGYALRLAQRYRTDHMSRVVQPDDFTLLDHLAGVYDEPFGDSSAIPTFQVCALARQGVTVALSGDGGDELFAGYRRYRMHQWTEVVRRRLPAALRGPVFGALGCLYPKADWAPRWLRAKTTFEELAVDACRGYFRAVSVTGEEVRRRLFSPAFRRELQGYGAEEVLRHHMARAQTDDVLLKLQYVDLKTWLAGGILVKVDRASMANSLEVRAPLLDHTLVEWSARLAPSLKLGGGESKRVLKRALEPLVDHDLLYRPKQGFSIPLARWLRGPLRPRLQAAADGPLLADTGIFEPGAVRAMVGRHVSGRFDHARPLWLLLMFEAFLRRETGETASATVEEHAESLGGWLHRRTIVRRTGQEP